MYYENNRGDEMRGLGESVFRQCRNGIIKRLVAAVLTLFLMSTAVVDFSAAEKEFYSTYTPKSGRSSFFYIDVFCETEISAAVFEMQYDDSIVSYDSAAAVNADVTLRDNVQDGKVKVAFAVSKSTDGQLCRLSFKALQTGEVSFVLHMDQAAGADKMKLPQMADDTLTITLGKNDVVAGGTSSKSGASSHAGNKSFLEEGDSSQQGGLFDFMVDKDNPMKWMFIGAGIVLLIGLLILIGIAIGRRMQNPMAQKENPPSKEETDDEE